MGIFGWGKKAVAAEMVGRNVTALLIDFDTCWRYVGRLRSYTTEDQIAVCEVAFARAAFVKYMLKERQPEGVAKRMDKAVDAAVEEIFAGEKDTEATRTFYGESLQAAALKRVGAYSDHTFMETQLASVLGTKLGVPGMHALEIAPMFRDIANDVQALTAKITIV